VIGPVGTFGRRQLKQLASVPGTSFPPPCLDLDQLQLEPADVLQMLKDKPLGESTGVGAVDLSLFCHEGQLAWRVLQEVASAGFRTLVLHARDGQVLYEKVDPWCDPGTGSRGGAQRGGTGEPKAR
jgi:hypothetical protein